MEGHSKVLFMFGIQINKIGIHFQKESLILVQSILRVPMKQLLWSREVLKTKTKFPP